MAYRAGDYSGRLLSNRITRLHRLSANVHTDQPKLDISHSNITARAYHNEQRILHVNDWNNKILTEGKLQKVEVIESWNKKLGSIPLDSENEFTALFKEITNLNFGESVVSGGNINNILPFLDRNEISKQLKLRIPLMKHVSNICTILWVMGSTKLTIKGKDMIIISDLIIEALDKYKYNLNSYDLSHALTGLARLGIKININTNSKSFLDSLVKNLPLMDDQQLSSTLWGLGKTINSWDCLPLKIRNIINKTLIKRVGTIGPLGLSNIIHGLSNLRIQWYLIPYQLQEVLYNGLKANLLKMKEQEIANTISGLGRMNAQYRALPSSITKYITDSFVKNIESLGPKGLAMTMHGLGRMSASFLTLPTLFKENVMNSIVRVAPEVNAQELANVVYGLGKMNTKLGSSNSMISVGMNKKARNALLDAFIRVSWEMSAQGIANTVYGLMLMDAKWLQLSHNVRLSIVTTISREAINMDEQQIANTIYSLGKMGVTDNLLPAKLRQQLLLSIEARCGDFTVAGLIMTLGGLSKMNIKWLSLPSSLRYSMLEACSKRISNIVSAPGLTSVSTLSGLLNVLAGIGLTWTDLGIVLQTNIEETIAKAHWKIHGNSLYLPIYDENSLSQAKLLTLDVTEAAQLLLDIPPTATKLSTERSSKSNNFNIVSTSIRPIHEKTETKYNHSLIYSLGQMAAKWDDFGFSTKTALYNSMVDSVPTSNEQGVVNTLQGLVSLGVKWSDLRKDVNLLLQDAIIKVAPAMEQQGVSVTFLSLAKLEVNWSVDLSEDVRTALRLAITRQSQLGEHALSSLLYGLGKLQHKWDKLHPEKRKVLKEALVVMHVQNHCTPIGVANSLHGLANMEADWSDLSSSVRLALNLEIIKAIPLSTESQFASIIYSLSKMKCNWNFLPYDLHNVILRELELRLPVMNEQQISNALYALGEMGLRWSTHFSSSFQDDIIVNCGRILASSNIMTSFNCVSSILAALSKLEATYVTLPSQFVSVLEQKVEQQITSMTPSKVAGTINSMAKLLFRWSIFSERTKKRLLSSLFRISNTGGGDDRDFDESLSSRDCALIINGLGRLGANWNDIATNIQQVLNSMVVKVLRKGNANDVSSLMYGLGLMDFSMELMGYKVRKELTNGILRTFNGTHYSPLTAGGSSNLSNKVGVQSTVNRSKYTPFAWLIESNSNKETHEISPQNVANMMYSLSLLSFDMKASSLNELLPVHQTLLDNVSKLGLSRFNEVEIEQILIYVNLLQTLAPVQWQDIEQRHMDRFIFTKVPTEERRQSKLQQSVITSLSKALSLRNSHLHLENEYSAFNGVFPVDAMVCDDNNTVVAFVEVDGPHHFTKDGKLRRKDLLKEALYRVKYPFAAFTRVRFDQVNKLGSSYVGKEVANYINIAYEHSPVTTVNDNIYHEYDEMLGWVSRQAARELKLVLDPSISNNVKLKHHGDFGEKERFEYSNIEYWD